MFLVHRRDSLGAFLFSERASLGVRLGSSLGCFFRVASRLVRVRARGFELLLEFFLCVGKFPEFSGKLSSRLRLGFNLQSGFIERFLERGGSRRVRRVRSLERRELRGRFSRFFARGIEILGEVPRARRVRRRGLDRDLVLAFQR